MTRGILIESHALADGTRFHHETATRIIRRPDGTFARHAHAVWCIIQHRSQVHLGLVDGRAHPRACNCGVGA